MKCFTTTRKLGYTQRHYDLFSQIVRVEKAMSKRTFLSFSTAPITVRKGRRTF
jgi:hypothetical protein